MSGRKDTRLSKKAIVFIDFDGTITMEDSLVGTLRLFAPAEEFKLYSEKLAKGELTLSQVVRHGFDGAPAAWLPGMLDYVKTIPLRPGFPEFLDEMDRRGIPVVVISGGMRQFVELRLAPYLSRFAGLHAVELETDGEVMHLNSPYDNGDELLAKTEVMKLYDYDYAIGIGDSFTDRNMAKAVDTVFARDILAKFLTKAGIPFLPYEDFHQVIAQFPDLHE